VNKVKNVLYGKIDPRMDALYNNLPEPRKADASLAILSEIEGLLEDFRNAVAEKNVDRTMGIQLATQYAKIAEILVKLESYLNAQKEGKEPDASLDQARKYVSNTTLILNGFVDMAIEIDRDYTKHPTDSDDVY
jgi:hypothetical protein